MESVAITFIVNLLFNLPVKGNLKKVDIWRSYRQEYFIGSFLTTNVQQFARWRLRLQRIINSGGIVIGTVGRHVPVGAPSCQWGPSITRCLNEVIVAAIASCKHAMRWCHGGLGVFMS